MPIISTRIKVSEGNSAFIDNVSTQAVDEYSKEFIGQGTSSEDDITPRNITTIQHLYIKNLDAAAGTILFASSGTAITINSKNVILLTQTSEAVVLNTGTEGGPWIVASGGT